MTKKKDALPEPRPEEIVPAFGITTKNIHPLMNFNSPTLLGVFLPRLNKEKVINDLFIVDTDKNIQHASCYQFAADLLPLEPQFSQEVIQAYLKGEATIPTFQEVYDLLYAQVKKYVEFQDDAWTAFWTLWIIGTYFYRMFEEYPYVWFNGPRGSGKSRGMKIASLCAFHPTMVVGTKPAPLFRRAALGCTLLYDECEELWNTKNNDSDVQDKLAVLNAGYSKGTYVERMERENDRWVLKQFEAYCPKAFGSISEINYVSASRAVRIQMLKEKGLKYATQKPRQEDPVWQEFKDKMFLLVMTQSEKVRQVKEKLSLLGVGGTLVSFTCRQEPTDANIKILDIKYSDDLNSHLTLSNDKKTDTFSLIPLTDSTFQKFVSARNWDLWLPILSFSYLLGSDGDKLTYRTMLQLAIHSSYESLQKNQIDNDEFFMLQVLLELVGKDDLHLDDIQKMKTKELKDKFKELKGVSPDSEFPSSNWVNRVMANFGFIHKLKDGYPYWGVKKSMVIDLIQRYTFEEEKKPEPKFEDLVTSLGFEHAKPDTLTCVTCHKAKEIEWIHKVSKKGQCNDCLHQLIDSTFKDDK